MDCFYAAVEEKHNPSLRGKPVAVGGPPDTRSVLCTANYEARKFGVRAALPSSQAMRKCPQLILLPPNFDLYRKESRGVHEILERFTDQIEPLSLDEAYLDVSASNAFHGSATLIAKEIKKMISQELKLSASAGVASNKFLAKVASEWKKPNGIYVIRPEEVDSFVYTLPIEKIFGVGRVTADKMHRLKIYTCGDLQQLTLNELHHHFGSRAQELFHFARGIDNRPVISHWERKSVSVEETFKQDLKNMEELRIQLPSIYKEWTLRICKKDYSKRIRTAFVKLKFSDFRTTTHEESTHKVYSIKDFERMLEFAWKRSDMPIRLAGLGARLHTTEKSSESQLNFYNLAEN